MGTIEIERVVAVRPDQLWDVVTDWPSYARWMPLTIMRLDPGPTRVGWSSAGLTGVGRLCFSDLMRVTHWAPPSSSRGRGDTTAETTAEVTAEATAVTAAETAGETGREAEAGLGSGTFRLVKVGRLLAGWAEVSVTPIEAGTQTRLLWREEIVIRPVVLGRLLAPLTDRFSKALFTTVVDAMAAEARQVSGQV